MGGGGACPGGVLAQKAGQGLRGGGEALGAVCRPSSRSPKALEMNLLELAATEMTPYLLGVRYTRGDSMACFRAHLPYFQSLDRTGGGTEFSVGHVPPPSSAFVRHPPTNSPTSKWEQSWVSPVRAAHCLRIASAPPGRLEREPVAMVTTRLQTSAEDKLVAGCGFLALQCRHVTGTVHGSVLLFHGEMCHHRPRWPGGGSCSKSCDQVWCV